LYTQEVDDKSAGQPPEFVVLQPSAPTTDVQLKLPGSIEFTGHVSDMNESSCGLQVERVPTMSNPAASEWNTTFDSLPNLSAPELASAIASILQEPEQSTFEFEDLLRYSN